MIKNILVPVDGSEGSDKAVAKAIGIAEVCGAKLYFIYVANINQLAINAALSIVKLPNKKQTTAIIKNPICPDTIPIIGIVVASPLGIRPYLCIK